MSEVLMLTLNTGLLPRSISSRAGFITTTTIQTQILGHSIKEVQVITTTKTDLPIPIKLPSPKSPERYKTMRSVKSPFSSPMQSPRSFASSKTLLFSPKSGKTTDQRQVFSCKRSAGQSPRQDIDELLKNSVKQGRTELKIKKNKAKQELKSKLQKKLQMKVLDEFIREENFNKFKQKFPSSRPRWGVDDKKVISDTKVLREIEKVKKMKKPKKNLLTFQVFAGKKKRIKKKVKEIKETKEVLDDISEVNEDYSDHKKDLFQKIKNLANRVEQFRIENQPAHDRKLEKMIEMLEKWQKRIVFLKFLSVSSHQSSESVSYLQVDNEVQKIMNHQKSPFEVEESKSEANKSYEKLLENQVKINKKQQKQLISLKTRDMQEMSKLAEVLGGNPEMKKKFEGIIERRYSKLENLFQENLENIKQVLGLEDLDLEEEKNLEDAVPGLRNTISEFSSSFLMQLNDVPMPVNLTFEDPPAQGDEFIESPSEESLYSRDTLSEPEEKILKFPETNSPNVLQIPQEEPSIPLISESVEIEAKLQTSADSIEQLVGGISSRDDSDDCSAENTLDLKTPALQQQTHMFILEDSYGSGESGSNANFSSISFNTAEAEVKEESHHSESRSGRMIIEKFPSPFTDMYESSTEIEGYELIINRIVFTLEKDVFNVIYEELKEDDEYWANIPKKTLIAVRMSLQEFENQVQTDSIAVLSAFKRMQKVKNASVVIDSVLQIYNPMLMLCRIQEDYGDEDSIQIFDYSDFEKVEKSSNISMSVSASSLAVNPFKATHNKVLVDAVNEAICRSAKKKVNMPWKIQDQVFVLEYDSLMKAAAKKLVKWAEIEAGKIPTSDLLNSFGNLDEDKLQAVRQERLAQFLIVDVAESEKSWVECDLEETQVALNVADFVFDVICWEALEIFAYP